MNEFEWDQNCFSTVFFCLINLKYEYVMILSVIVLFKVKGTLRLMRVLNLSILLCFWHSIFLIWLLSCLWCGCIGWRAHCWVDIVILLWFCWVVLWFGVEAPLSAAETEVQIYFRDLSCFRCGWLDAISFNWCYSFESSFIIGNDNLPYLMCLLYRQESWLYFLSSNFFIMKLSN